MALLLLGGLGKQFQITVISLLNYADSNIESFQEAIMRDFCYQNQPGMPLWLLLCYFLLVSFLLPPSTVWGIPG